MSVMKEPVVIRESYPVIPWIVDRYPYKWDRWEVTYDTTADRYVKIGDDSTGKPITIPTYNVCMQS